MKISELNTKSFLGGTGAAANSYVLINYEDNSTSEPVTYKASLQELGKAIANDLKLPSVTVSEGAITNFKVKGVSNGAYTETVVAAPLNGPSMGDVASVTESAIMNQKVVLFDVQSSHLQYYSSSALLDNVTSRMISGAASTGYVDDAVSGLASTGDVTDAVNGLASTGYVNDVISDLASTGYVDDAVSGLASTGYVTTAVANAGGGGSFDPIEYEESEYLNSKIVFMNDSYILGYYGGGASTFVQLENYVRYDPTNQVLTYHDGDGNYDHTLEVVLKYSGVAYIDSSDNKPCIRNESGDFVGFLSTT